MVHSWHLTSVTIRMRTKCTNAQKSKSAVTFAISSSCYYLLGLGLVLLCIRLSLFVVYAIFVLEMGNEVGLFVVCL